MAAALDKSSRNVSKRIGIKMSWNNTLIKCLRNDNIRITNVFSFFLLQRRLVIDTKTLKISMSIALPLDNIYLSDCYNISLKYQTNSKNDTIIGEIPQCFYFYCQCKHFYALSYWMWMSKWTRMEIARNGIIDLC